MGEFRELDEESFPTSKKTPLCNQFYPELLEITIPRIAKRPNYPVRWGALPSGAVHDWYDGSTLYREALEIILGNQSTQ